MLWTLEAVIALEPKQRELLEQIVAGELIQASELRELAQDDPLRQPPQPGQQTMLSPRQ